MYIYIHFALEFVLVFFGSSCVASYIQRAREKQSKINKMNFVNKRKNMIDTAAEAIKQAKKKEATEKICALMSNMLAFPD